MSLSQGLILISFNFHDQKVQTQGILLKESTPHDLDLEFLASKTDFPDIDLSETSSHLTALIYEFPLATSDFTYLETSLKPSHLAILSEPNTDFGIFHILTSQTDIAKSSSSFNGASFMLFTYNYSEILGSDLDNYQKILRIMKANKSKYIQNSQKNIVRLEELNEESKENSEICVAFTSRMKNLKDEIENAKIAVQQLTFQVDKKRAQVNERKEINLTCELCKEHDKNTVLIPCGHIVYCDNCVSRYGKVPKDEGMPSICICPICSEAVKEFKTIKFE